MPPSSAYEAKYGFPLSYSRLLFVCVAFAFGSFLVALPAAVRSVELVVFGGGGVALLVLGMRATRLAALRVDESGVTLGGSPLKYRSTTRHVPWPELRAVRLSRDPQTGRLPVLTAVRRGNREDLTTPLQGWRVDPDKLAEALKTFGKGVSLLDNR